MTDTTYAPTLFDAPQDVTAPVPARSHRDDNLNSYLTATRRSNTVRWGTHRAQLLQALAARGPLSDEAVGAHINLTHEQATRRLSELLRDGLIVETGRIATTVGGNPCRVVEITEAGRAALRAAIEKRGAV